jgi:hypothetical protein
LAGGWEEVGGGGGGGGYKSLVWGANLTRAGGGGWVVGYTTIMTGAIPSREQAPLMGGRGREAAGVGRVGSGPGTVRREREGERGGGRGGGI